MVFVEQELVALAAHSNLTFGELVEFVDQCKAFGVSVGAKVACERSIAGYLERISCPVEIA